MKGKKEAQKNKQMASRLSDWKRFHQKNYKKISAETPMAEESVAEEKKDTRATTPVAPEETIVIFDCYFLRVSEEGTTSKGSNILKSAETVGDFLAVTLNPQSYHSTVTKSDEGTTFSKIFDKKITWGAIKYNLNIANAAAARVEVVGRPSLTTYLNKKAFFNSGEELKAGIQGTDGGSVSSISIGAMLEIVPYRISKDSVTFSIKLMSSILEEQDYSKSIADQILKINSTTIQTDIEVRFNDTAMLGGIYQRTDMVEKSGVPLLQNIPFVQYLFSSESTISNKKSVLFLVTPRRLTGFNEAVKKKILHLKHHRPPSVQELLEQEGALLKSPYNMAIILEYLKPVYREFRKGDILPAFWGRNPPLEEEIQQILEFFYF
jgi:general secretion pathway protein D